MARARYGHRHGHRRAHLHRDMTRSSMVGWFSAAAFVGTVFVANWVITAFGLVPVGFGLVAPAGVYMAGLAFSLRDMTQERLGRGAVCLCIVIGAVCSSLLSVRFAVASGIAFLVSEMLDFVTYVYVRPRG